MLTIELDNLGGMTWILLLMQGSENFEIVNSKELYMFLKREYMWWWLNDLPLCFFAQLFGEACNWATDFHFVSLSIETAIIV